MSLQAEMTSKTVSTNLMRYKDGVAPSTVLGEGRAHDSCYYEINAPSLEDMEALFPAGTDLDRIKIFLRIETMTEMNVYIYGGLSRFDAKEGIISGNT